ncbi:MAG: hypothetical protein JNJ89_05870 [Rubrivivax sp.]|nr:hypothetical protein [Rubrivivax sp.]
MRDTTTLDSASAINDYFAGLSTPSLTYDPADRLASVTRSGDNQTFTWDAVGNRTAHTRTAGSWTATLQPAANRYTSLSNGRAFGYDGLGNLTADSQGGRSYVYDGFNRLHAVYVNGAITADYRSNALNQRALKSALGVGTRFIYDPSGQLLHEEGPQITNYVWLGGELLGVVAVAPSTPATTTIWGAPRR